VYKQAAILCLSGIHYVPTASSFIRTPLFSVEHTGSDPLF
jgi:hypothetical protein